MIIPNIYDLEAQGVNPMEFFNALSAATRKQVAASWEFRARPGQRWTPGPEFITDYECGRGFGKNFGQAENMCDASLDPERWGGYAVIGGPDPLQVKRDCITALISAAQRRAKAGIGPGIQSINYNDRKLQFEAPKGGGTGGLQIQWGASSNPKSFRGPNYGLAWLDEFGVWYHEVRDQAGKNAWEALEPAIRAGTSAKVIITQTPSMAPQVRALQRDAERPECLVCRKEHLSKTPDGIWRGEMGQEPWRLPSSPRPKVHPLLGTRTTQPVRTCPTCSQEVIAVVRLVTGSTLDNPFIDIDARARASRSLGGGSQASRMEFDPQGESDSVPQGTLIDPDKVTKLHLEVSAQDADRWQTVLNTLGAERTLVFVDPAVTSNENSDDTGLVVSCLRRITTNGHQHDQVVGLQDATVRPIDLKGSQAPSEVWAPKAVWLAMCWGATTICVETNQGGAEVLASLRAALANIPSEDEILERISKEMDRPAVIRGWPSLMPCARRMHAIGKSIHIETVSRKSDKPTRWGWYGESASRQEQALLALDWIDGLRHWSPALAQAGAYDPGRVKKGKGKKDRFDAVIAAAQELLGVKEVKGKIKTPGENWMAKGVQHLFGGQE